MSPARKRKTTTGAKRKTARPPKAARGGTPEAPAAVDATDRLIVESPDELIVRMYRQGLGDCFLLAVPAAGGKTKYVLIDCGVHARETNGPARLMQVLKHLSAATGSHLDVVVATHEHADHLSGFVQKGSPFLKDTLTIDALWVAWTEKRGDNQADTLRKKRGAAQALIDKAVEEARQRAKFGGPAIADRLERLTDFDRPADGSVDADEVLDKMASLQKGRPRLTSVDALAALTPEPVLGVAKKGAKKKGSSKAKGPSSNELALSLLALKAGDNATAYCEPGGMREIAGVSNLRAYVLGPPRSDLLEKEKPSKIRGASEDDPGGAYKEVYLTATQPNRALELSPRLGLGATSDGGSVPDAWRFPFPPQFRRGCDFTAEPGVGRGRCWTSRPAPPESTQALVRDTYFADHSKWRRIDSDWLGSAEELALNLAGDTNNTSLALAFEWGKPGSGVVLLFAADAQIGNWLSWRDQKYGPGKLTVDDLLSRVLLYKVGHHGSHNSTLRRDPRDTSTPDPFGAPYGLELMNDIIAMIPVDGDAARKNMPDPWKMPHEPLYRRLREKGHRRVMRSDLELSPLDPAREKKDLVPQSEAWEPVPGVEGARWRRSREKFKDGTDGPLCYDLAITLPR
jgi:hypothetical protein